LRLVDLQGNRAVLAGLWRAAREGRLAHALCFVGPEGVGKFLAAERLTAGLLCATANVGEPCGKCGPCKRLMSDGHPDVFVVDPTVEGLESISIGHVTPRAGGPERTIEQFLSLLPMEGGWRVVLVREADRLVEEAQNALLKTLEEPGDATLLVLETARPDRLLPTIHSRCVRVPFEKLGAAEVRAVLEREVASRRGELDLPATRIAQLSRWSNGAPGIALALGLRGALEMRPLIETALRAGADPFALAKEVAEIEGEFPGATAPARSRARARTFLDLCADVLRDGLRATAGIARDDLPHGDVRMDGLPEGDGREGDLAAEDRNEGREHALEGLLAKALERILAARQDVDANLAPDAAVERALVALEPLRSKKPARASRR
jgi:DNA polymerase III delta' subunit